jgi:glycopeptide antibiotics resistance protein
VHLPIRLLTSDNALVAYATVVVAVVVGLVTLRRDGAAKATWSGSLVMLVGAVVVLLMTTLAGATAPGGRLNLVPGASILGFDQEELHNWFENVAGNIMLFLPLGFFGRLALRRRVAVLTAVGAALSIAIELTQLVLGDRWVDIDDVLLNTFGTFAGALVASMAVEAARRHQHSDARSSLREPAR